MNWFNQAFGFDEESYNKTRDKLLSMVSDNSINNIRIGDFKIVTAKQILDNNSECKSSRKRTLSMSISSHSSRRERALSYSMNLGRVKLTHLENTDIVDIHKDPKNHNCVIQVASQLNCLEMINPYTTPEHGITLYRLDDTQGPLCAMCTPAGIAYRNYIYNGGQTSTNQINIISKLEDNIGVKLPIQNGYLLPSGSELFDISREVIKHDFSELLDTIGVGFHTNMGVCINGVRYPHTVNHVLCSGLPLTYADVYDYKSWYILSDLILKAMYVCTLLCAVSTNSKCYLTKLGGGIFGMDSACIAKAIEFSCEYVASLGYSLQVYLVHYAEIERDFADIKTTY